MLLLVVLLWFLRGSCLALVLDLGILSSFASAAKRFVSFIFCRSIVFDGVWLVAYLRGYLKVLSPLDIVGGCGVWRSIGTGVSSSYDGGGEF